VIDYQAQLNPAQYDAVMTERGPVLVIAGAGSGKTRTLVFRVARLVETGVEPGRILLLTFTRRAAAEMLDRAAQVGDQRCRMVPGGTFHAVAHRILRRHATRLGYPENYTVIDREDAESILKQLRDEVGGKGSRLPKKATLANVVSKIINVGLDLDGALERYYPHLIEHQADLEKIALKYEAYKHDMGLMDFDDLLVNMWRLLSDQPEVGARVAARYDYLMVDEYQDTNHLQAAIVRLLARDHDNVMVVGDDSQSIYSFRGARFKNIIEFPDNFPGARLIKIEQNYRSTQPILDLTNHIIAGAAESYTKCLFTENAEGPRPRLVRTVDEKHQSRLVIDRIRGLIDGGLTPDRIAVLMRASFHSFDLEVELASAGMTYVKVGGFKFLELAHVKDLLSHLRVVVNPRDFYSWQRILRLIEGVGPGRGQQIIRHLTRHGPEAGYPEALASAPFKDKFKGIGDLQQALLDMAAPGLRPLDVVERAYEYYEPLLRRNHPDDYPKRMRDLEHLVSLVHDQDSLEEFVAQVALDPPISEPIPEGAAKLTLSTIHSAKGLEWDAVFIIWAAEGRFPSPYAEHDPEELEEERRLLYVAATRARRHLTILYPGRFFVRGEGEMIGRPSRFLEGAPAESIDAPRTEGQGWASPVRPAPVRPATRPAAVSKFATGQRVCHDEYGPGRIVGFKGGDQVMVQFDKFGLKIVFTRFGGLDPTS
jgi:DNA helicase-2/ATP-dependent DNA helicase PcrA